MKEILGSIIMSFGFGLAVLGMNQDMTIWSFVIGFCLFLYGLNVVITVKVENSRQKIIEDMMKLTEDSPSQPGRFC